ncbi:metallophosphoesterase [Alicyclobacillus cycloheptanicus]|uniref:Phosphoesterase n=1 Tax=Alicyclobacillus cycloheptanicus TaxID=1457 RepID=A0ABT9XDD1_9BACL|nr:metallophosphoesterase [Alicyclobacillus cycloheptanicus]MDQ0188280.1 putative phosphoesterase [Alicyclobacillus cycloheptanicus]WDM00999.1 metallophosphoesterase [Alicyclobacillus cycloheptanicus]
MRLCLVSDTHRFRHELLMAVKAAQPVDAVIHAGDETADAAWLAERVRWPVLGVAGNWDSASDHFPEERVLTSFGPVLLVTHGHRDRVKGGLADLRARADRTGAQIVVFGHTHRAMAVFEDGVLFVNPGSLSSPRGRRERTFALLEITANPTGYDVRVSHWTVTGHMISDSLLTAAISAK